MKHYTGSIKDHTRRARRKKRSAGFFVLVVLAAALAGGAWSAYSLVRDMPSPERISEIMRGVYVQEGFFRISILLVRP